VTLLATCAWPALAAGDYSGSVSTATDTVTLTGRLRKLPAGSYQVAARLTYHGLKSATVDVALEVR
jgi:hypothetical protein